MQLTPEAAAEQFRQKSYYIVAFTVLLFSVSGLWGLRKAKLNKAKFLKWVVTIVGLSLLTLPWHFSESHGVKIVNDEALLLGSAYQMHEARDPAVPMRGYQMQGEFTVVETFIDKRPLLYPFLLSLVHDVAGNHPRNAFWLNGILGIALCICVFALARSTCDNSDRAGWMAALLTCSVPLIGRSVLSAGFETLNLLMLTLVFIAARQYAQAANKRSFLFLASSTLLAAQVRYESAFVILAIAVLVLWLPMVRKKTVTPWGLLAPLCILTLPIIWQNEIRQSRESFSKLYVETDTQTFSFENFIENLPEAATFFFQTNWTANNSITLALLGPIAIIAYFVLFLKRRSWNEPESIAFALPLAGLLGMCCVILFFFFSKFDNPLTQRLSLPFFLLFTLGIVSIFSIQLRGRKSPYAILAIAIIAWTVSSASGLLGYHEQKNYVHTEHEKTRQTFIEKHKSKSYLMVDPYSTIWLSHEVPVISYDRLRDKLPLVALHQSLETYESVYLFLDYYRNDERAKFILRDNCKYPKGLELETVEEVEFGPNSLVRIAKVINYPVEAKGMREAFDAELEDIESTDERTQTYWTLWGAYLP